MTPHCGCKTAAGVIFVLFSCGWILIFPFIFCRIYEKRCGKEVRAAMPFLGDSGLIFSAQICDQVFDCCNITLIQPIEIDGLFFIKSKEVIGGDAEDGCQLDEHFGGGVA